MTFTDEQVDRARHIIELTLPALTTRDAVMDRLYYVNCNNDETRLPSIAAALAVLDSRKPKTFTVDDFKKAAQAFIFKQYGATEWAAPDVARDVAVALFAYVQETDR